MTNTTIKLQKFWTLDGFEKFFKLYGCRAKVQHVLMEGIEQIIFKVPRSNYHFIRWFINYHAPMGVLVKIETLRLWECRLKKVQVTSTGEN